MPIAALPSISRSDTDFRTKVDDYFLTKLPTFSTQAEEARLQIVAAESAAKSAASTASTDATTATTAANTATSARDSAVTAKNAAETAAAQAVSGNVATPIHEAVSKTTPVDADELGLSDSAASWALKKLTFANLKAWISSLGGAGISNTPSGNISATNMQAAINELDSEKVGNTGAQSMTGVLTAGGLLSNAGGIGYGVGSGGTVTQATSKSTSVTLNKPSGRITMHGAELAANTTGGFVLTTSAITVNDTLVVNLDYLETAASFYNVWAAPVGTNQAVIYVRNITGAPRSDALVINFAVIKGATS